MSIATDTRRVPAFIAGDRLRKAREVAHLTQSELAARIGVHRDSIMRAEGTDSPKYTIIAAYALATGVDFEWLQTGECTPRDLNPEPTD